MTSGIVCTVSNIAVVTTTTDGVSSRLAMMLEQLRSGVAMVLVNKGRRRVFPACFGRVGVGRDRIPAPAVCRGVAFRPGVGFVEGFGCEGWC